MSWPKPHRPSAKSAPALGLKGNSGDKHWYRMSKLIEAGFVYSDQGRYHITTSGRQELAYLDNEPEGEISVRVFAR